MKNDRGKTITGLRSGGYADMNTEDLKMMIGVLDSDQVNPPHYHVSGREKQPIELMRLGLTDEEFEGYCIGNIMKYILRYKYKGGDDDLCKAKEYIDFLLKSYRSEPILDDEE